MVEEKDRIVVLRELHYYGLDDDDITFKNYEQVDDFLGYKRGYIAKNAGKNIFKIKKSNKWYAVISVNCRKRVTQRQLKYFYDHHKWANRGSRIFPLQDKPARLSKSDRIRRELKSDEVAKALKAIDAKFGSIAKAKEDSPEFKKLRKLLDVEIS